jgi:hypothetical protein
MTGPRTNHVATLLADDKVLITGGSSSGPYSVATLASAELFDPATETFTATASMATARLGHSATLLASGKVLVVGGSDSAGAELFDPSADTFTATGRPLAARKKHTATLLGDGKVLVAGGYGGGIGLASAELYDPQTGAFTATGDLTAVRYEHAATLLRSRKVLLLGGFVPATDTGNNDGLTSAELYDPSSGAFAETAGSMSAHRVPPTATLLLDGKVLVSGGPHGFEGYFASGVLELYDPGTATFSATGGLVEARTAHTATLLPSGSVLFAGGYQGGGSFAKYLATAELYNPATGTCAATPPMTEAREYHTATALSDGRVLVAGGFAGNHALASAEIYR